MSVKNFVSGAAPAIIEFFEAPDHSAPGSVTSTGVRNLNRTGEDEANLSVTISPTITSVGSLQYIEGIAGESKAGGVGGNDYPEWILAPNTDYLVRFTNKSNADTTICIFNLGWYE